MMQRSICLPDFPGSFACPSVFPPIDRDEANRSGATGEIDLLDQRRSVRIVIFHDICDRGKRIFECLQISYIFPVSRFRTL